ncbi:MAG TPA: arginase family protein [Thermoanaerobaculia bacterium]|nr:arginase family protein [Thermoanaerobaculia bacterium]
MAVIHFPQWQGGNPQLRADRGAASMRSFLASLAPEVEREIVEIPVETGEDLPVERGVAGLSAILRQLGAAGWAIQTLAPARLALLGGDCSIEIAAVPYLLERYGEGLAALWIDAHGDLNTPEISPSHRLHGMPLRTLLGEGDPELVALGKPSRGSGLRPEQVATAGVRDLDPGELDYLDQHPAIRRFSVAEVETGPEPLVEALRAGGFSQVHVHLDLDAIDPADFPHTACPTPNGLRIDALMRLLRALDSSFDLVGLCLTECTAPTPREVEPLRPLLELFAQVGA